MYYELNPNATTGIESYNYCSDCIKMSNVCVCVCVCVHARARIIEVSASILTTDEQNT